jgi:hypothetical protein
MHTGLVETKNKTEMVNTPGRVKFLSATTHLDG